MTKSKRRRHHRERQAAARPLLDLDTAMDIIDDDMPDGAYWALLEEMTGMEPAEIADALESREPRP